MLEIEIIGILSTVVLILSMAWPSNNKKNISIMRIVNAISCVGFIIYSIFFSAYSTIISNSIILGIDIWYLYKALRKGER